jgi:hypothetical protein
MIRLHGAPGRRALPSGCVFDACGSIRQHELAHALWLVDRQPRAGHTAPSKCDLP